MNQCLKFTKLFLERVKKRFIDNQSLFFTESHSWKKKFLLMIRRRGKKVTVTVTVGYLFCMLLFLLWYFIFKCWMRVCSLRIKHFFTIYHYTFNIICMHVKLTFCSIKPIFFNFIFQSFFKLLTCWITCFVLLNYYNFYLNYFTINSHANVKICSFQSKKFHGPYPHP